MTLDREEFLSLPDEIGYKLYQDFSNQVDYLKGLVSALVSKVQSIDPTEPPPTEISSYAAFTKRNEKVVGISNGLPTKEKLTTDKVMKPYLSLPNKDIDVLVLDDSITNRLNQPEIGPDAIVRGYGGARISDLYEKVSHTNLQYSSVLLNGNSQSLIYTLEKQLNWGIKAWFNRYKMNSAQDFRIKHGIISVRQTLDMNDINIFWKWKHNLPAFSQPNLETARITSHERTKKLYYHAHTRSERMRNSLFKRVVSLWNVLPDKMKIGHQTYDTLKKRLKKYFTEQFISQVDIPQYTRKCWSVYRFK